VEASADAAIVVRPCRTVLDGPLDPDPHA
jgi:hypothetical protein